MDQLACVCLCMYAVELETEVHTKVRNHGEGPYKGLLLVESGYYHFHIEALVGAFSVIVKTDCEADGKIPLQMN